MNDVVIYTGCRIFEVRITVSVGSSLSPLEQHVLKAVAAGVDTVSGLCAVLGLSSRLMVDLLGDLWRSGHVSFDFSDERVMLTGMVRDLMAEGDNALDSLPGAEISDESQPMMLDTLSGLLTPVGGLYRAPNRNLAVPEHDGEAKLGGIDQAALVDAVTRALNDDGQPGGQVPGGRVKRVVRAYLSPAALTTPAADLHYRPIGVKVALDADDRLVARLADDAVPGRYRDAAQARLTRLIEDEPVSSFVHALRSAASGRPQEPTTLANALGELADRAAALGTARPDTRERDHAEMVTASGRIVDRLRGLAEQESGAGLLTGHAAHEAAIKQLISDAETQVVLACPWVSYPGFVTYAPLLEAAARRGVQVVLLWGIGRADVPEGEIRNALSALQRQASVRMVISPQASSVIHAKLAVGDDRQAVVTSLNFLDPSSQDTHEMGVLVDAMAGRRSPAIAEMLAWARDTMPDYAVAQSIIIDSDSFSSASGELDPEPVPDIADDPPLTEAASADAPGGPAASAWASAWRRRAEELAAASWRRRPSVRMIRDGEHRDFLWTALRTARRHLLITSDGMAEDVVDQAFIEHIQQCLERGVDVTLVYRRPRRESGAQAAQRLQDLSQAPGGPGRLRVVRRNNHAKVLVVDDEAMVTSFNFLSFEGYYSGVGRRRQRSEIGVRIYGTQFARRLLEAFEALPGGSAADGPAADEAASRARAALSQSRAFSVAQQLLDHLNANRDRLTGKQIAALAGSGSEALAVLEALSACGTDADMLEPVVAAVLGHHERAAGRAASDPEADGWWAWLARHRFERADFTVAAALRAAVPGTGARPRQALIDVAARRGTPELTAAIAEAALHDDLSRDEWHTLFAVTAHELLKAGGADLDSVISMALPVVDAPWARLGSMARAWWESTHRPLPADRIRRGEELRQMAAGDADDWAALDRQLRAFELYSPPFTAGNTTQRFLLRAGGPLNLLKLAADQRDRVAVRTWLADAKLKNVGAWVDAATRAAGSTKLIHGHLRPPFVDRVAGITSAARAVAEHDDPAAASPEPFDETIEAARALVRELRAELPALRSAAAAIGLPERALADVALEDLEQLAVGGGT